VRNLGWVCSRLLFWIGRGEGQGQRKKWRKGEGREGKISKEIKGVIKEEKGMCACR
jgi:hypothetical protein